MTDFTMPGRHNVVLAGFARIGKEISFYLDSLRAAVRAHNAYETMSMMSNAELARRGLAREDVPAYIVRRYFTDQA